MNPMKNLKGFQWILGAAVMTAVLSVGEMTAMSAPKSVYDVSVKSIEGREYAMSEYRGKVVLVVNTASECGYTPQYKDLQALHDRYSAQGLVVLGMPCNQFGGQEPGEEKEIKNFCERRFGVKFPLLAKGDVSGPSQHALYGTLLAQTKSPGPVKWNFEKFLVDRQGQVVGRFPSKVEPMSPELTKAIESALAAKP